MKIKSYFARTVEDAMALARQELGPDAMLVNSRKAAPERRGLGDYEVVFASDAGGGDSQAVEPSAQPFGDRLSAEIADLKRELEGMRRAITRSAFAPSQWLASSPALSEAYAALAAGEVNPELARDVVHAAAARAEGASRDHLAPPALEGAVFQRALVDELESRISTDPSVGRDGARPRIVALIGPPGSGKTTMLVKLAVNYGLAAKRPILLLSMGTYRVAAAEQLRSYAGILGVGFHVLETVSALSQAIEESRTKELILIDTPGFGFQDMECSSSLAGFLSSRTDIDTQLVLPSSMKAGDLRRVVDAFDCFGPQRLIFTKLDETASFGPIFNEAARTKRPLSFFGTGQRIPEDLEGVARGRISELLLAGESARALSAA